MQRFLELYHESLNIPRRLHWFLSFSGDIVPLVPGLNGDMGLKEMGKSLYGRKNRNNKKNNFRQNRL